MVLNSGSTNHITLFARGEVCTIADAELVGKNFHNSKMMCNNILKWFKNKIVNTFSGCYLGKYSGSSRGYTDIQRKQILELELFIF
jgi:hypothetical protein